MEAIKNAVLPYGGVPTVTLLDGHSLPWLGWGNGTGDAKKTAVDSGSHALTSGIRHIDTAQGYNNEEETGKSLKDSSQVTKADVWVTTKLSQEDGAADKDPIKVEDVRQSVHGSVRRLGFVPDLLLVHNPFVPEQGKLVEFWKVLEDMKDRGELTSSLGVSNFRPQDLEELFKVAKYKPVVNQLEYHPYVLTHLEPVLKICAEHSIVIESYGPLSPILRHPSKGGPLIPILDRIATRLGGDADQAAVLLLWVKAKGAVAVTASGNPGRIEKLAAIQKMGDLTKEEVAEIDEVGKKIHFRAYPEHMCVDFPAPKLPEDL